VTEQEAPTVLVRAQGGLGRITLNRPRAINALNVDMLRAVGEALEQFRDDPSVDIVLLDGEGDRGFCAGGDVRSLREMILAGHADDTGEFFRVEYNVNDMIAEYPKPIVAFGDGVTMGGGIGLAGHASVRVVTERSRLAMPETRIGLTPDVGGSWLLAHAPGRIGEYLALTGAVMDASDAIYAGLADHLVPSKSLPALLDALETRADPSTPNELVLLFDETAGPSALEAAQPWIDEVFSADTVSEIVQRLEARPEPEASHAVATMAELSPTSMAVTLAAVRAARELPDLRAALAQEYGLVLWFANTQPDLVEGIRAQLVDKDRSPTWQPASNDEVGAGVAASALAYMPHVPLWS